jgi:DNA polymerase-3 subunit delta'
MSLKEVFCQDKAISILQRAYTAGKVPHAYIFAGQEGVGKFTTAREWAKLLLCKNPAKEDGFADSCGVCESCRLIESDSHPDFHHVYKELLQYTEDNQDKKTPVEFAIDVVREFVIGKVSSRPGLSARRVFVLSEAEKLNNESQNCLLKVLEEPPEYCCIILVCTRLDRMLSTIKSRCQTVRFGPVDEDRIVEKAGGLGLEETKARYFARLAEGSLGLACQWGRLELDGAGVYGTKRRIIDSVADLGYSDCLKVAQRLLDESKEISAVWEKLEPATSRSDIKRRIEKTLVQIVASVFHDVMVLNITPAKSLVNFDQKGQIEKIARRFDAEQSAEKIAECFKSRQWIEDAVNERLIFEHLLLNLADSDTIYAQ